MRSEVVVRECLFHESLAVVKGPLNGDGDDVAAERRHLRFLNVGHLSLGIQHNDSRVRYTVKCLRNRAAGIPRGRHQDGQRGPIGKVMKQTRLRSGTNVFEGHRRPVEQLERRDIFRDRHERNREIQRVADDRPHVRDGDLVTQQMRSHDGADFDDVTVGGANGCELIR